MADANSILMYESALDAQARKRIREIRWADILIGIPTHRNARTLPEVVSAVSAGITQYLPGRRVVLMNADGGSSDNTVRIIAEATIGYNTHILLNEYQGTIGKGTAVRSIFEAAHLLGVKACMILEARAPGILPEWLPALIEPILRGDELALGYCQRSAFSASLTDNLAYPLVRVFLNSDLRDPVSPEFCLSGELAGYLAGRDVWETDITRFGVNAWMTTEVMAERRRVSQIDLGFRGENSFEAGTVADTRFLHAVAALFRSLNVHRERWREAAPLQMIPFRGGRSIDRTVREPEFQALLAEAVWSGKARHEDLWPQILCEDTLSEVIALFAGKIEDDPVALGMELWAKILVEFAAVYNQGEGDPDKVIEALLPLFYARSATYMDASRDMTVGQREELVDELVGLVAANKGHFVSLWDSYETDLDADATYWLT